MGKYLKNRSDVIVVVTGAFSILTGSSVLLYDIVLSVMGTIDPNRDMSIITVSIVTTILGAFCFWIVYRDRRRPGDPPRPPPDDPDQDSYLHPDHHPKGRRDAPDGTSD